MALRITAIALLIAGVIAWLWLRAPESPKLPVLNPTAGLVGSKEAAIDVEMPAATASDEERSEVQAVQSDEIPASISLLVLDGDGGAPVADVEVCSLEWPENSPENYLMHRGERGALAEWIEQHGHRTRTDAKGEARLPRAKTLSSVYAKEDSRWALKDYVAGDERVVLALARERAFEVHVSSKEGADAKGVDVVFRSLDWWGIQFHSETDEHGIARFRHLAPFMRGDVPEACEVTICGLFTYKRPHHGFPAQTELPARVELTLPPCGSLDVEFVDIQGAPIETESSFQFVTKNADGADWVFGSVQRTSPNGRTRLEWVEVGVEFEATATSVDRKNSAQLLARGPTQSAEIVRLRLQAEAHPFGPWALYRAVDEKGAVLANQALKFVVRDFDFYGASEPWGPVDTTTDDAGVFRLPVAAVNEPNEDLSKRRVVQVTTERFGRAGVLSFDTEIDTLSALLQPEAIDAVFKPSQRILAGHVVDESGVAVPQAQVRLYNADDDAPTPRMANNPDRQIAWVVSDSKGAFEARGFFPGNSVRVIANPGGARESPPVVAPTGASDVILTVASSGSLEGSILLPEGSIATDVSVEWAGIADTSGGTRDYATNAAEPGLALFRLNDLRAGPGIMRVMVNASVVETFTDVVVAPRAPTRDPRLQRIDLRERLRPLRIWVDKPDGTPASNGIVHVTRRTAPGIRSDFSTSFNISRGKATCLVPSGPVDLTIAVEDLRNETMLAVTDRELRVRLRPSYEVTLQFRGADLPVELIARLDPTVEPRRNSKTVRGGARMGVPLEAAGRWTVRLELPGKQVAIGTWPIDVADTDTPQEFALDVDPKLLEQAWR